MTRPSSQRAATSPVPSILALGPLGHATPSSRGGTSQDHGWRPPPAVPRSTAIVQAIWPCTGLDRARLRRLSLALELGPQTVGALQARALASGPRPPWQRDALLQRRHLSRPRVAAAPLLCLGRPPLCGPFDFAHGLDRARLRRLSLALELGPQTVGALQARASLLAPGPLGDAMASS
jgi:hypothetical protein